jgi:deoxyribose-phosphate aldolase
MTPLELDQLIREIGEEVQRRLGPFASPAHACACGTAVTVTGNGAAAGWAPSRQGIAEAINQALLWPDAGEEEIRGLCREARHYRFGSVCVQPSRVAVAVRELRATSVKVAAVIGYPHGATLTPVKLAEAAQVLKLGATELELTIHPGALRWGELDAVYTEIRLAAECARAAAATLKVMAEMTAMGDEQKATLCALARLGGADIVKTSADLAGAAAAAGDVALAHRIVGGELGIEAAGGIDGYARFREMLAAGATRVATAAGVAIVSEAGTL